MILSLVFIFLLNFAFLGANPFLERLSHAKVGNFVITEQGKTRSLIRVHSLQYPNLILEEISFPSHLSFSNWQAWVQNRATGHTSWVMYEIDLEQQTLLESFSFSRGCWLQAQEGETLLKTFLQLPLNEASQESRRKIGPPPMPGEIDRRSFWTPPMIVKGEKVEPSFVVYQGLWPKDLSTLSEKHVELYFDAQGNYPFPFWVQAKTDHFSVFMRVVDSGENLISPYRSLPRRSPYVEKKLEKQETLEFVLRIPKYCHNAEILCNQMGNSTLLQENKDYVLKQQESHPESFILTVYKKSLPQKPISLFWVPKKYPYLFCEL